MRIWVISLAVMLVAAASVSAVDDEPLPVPPSPISPLSQLQSPEARYNAGLALAKRQEWRAAEEAYRDALRARPAFPEAWNGLGYALRKQKSFEQSVRAYQEALRLRPAYPQALEYLGEAYAQMGRLDDARALLERLRALNAPEAAELAEAIAAAMEGRSDSADDAATRRR